MTTWKRTTIALALLAALAASPVAAKELYEWSEAASGNGFAVPDGFPEGMLKSTVNDATRELMAVVRRAYANEMEWLHLWHDKTVSYDSAQVVRVAAVNATSYFMVSRRVRLAGGASAQFGTVDSASYSAPDTLVTVTLDGAATVDVLTSQIKVHMGSTLPLALWNLGTSATKNTGTGAGDVPLNSDLGTAAILAHGTGAGDLPKNSDLGTIAVKNIPDYAYKKKTTTDQVNINTTANFTFDGVTDYIVPAGADGAKKYRVHATFPNISNGSWFRKRFIVRMGALGTIADPTVWHSLVTWGASGWDVPLYVSGLELVPSAGDRISFGLENFSSGGGTGITVYGSGTSPSSLFGFAWIEEIIQ